MKPPADKSRTIAHALNAGAIDECEANARLIAAAPDLLAALIRMEEDMTAADVAQFGTVSQTVKQARAAITKATGGEA